MKVLYKILPLFMISIMLWSCEKDGTQFVASDGIGGDVSASVSTLVLKKEEGANKAITITWKAADFGYPAAITQVLQMDLKGNNFSSPKEVPLPVKATSIDFTVMEFNQLILPLGIPFQQASDLEFRVKSTISTEVAPVFSNVIPVKVTPYELISWIYVPGDYQGWDPTKADSLKSATGNGVYSGIIYYSDKQDASFEFKITPKKSWDTAYGDAGDGKLTASGGNNIKGPGAGSYQLDVDLNANTWKMSKNSWGVIGDGTASGWDSDQDLIYDNGSGLWKATLVLKTGEIKFRFNDDWGKNLGGDGTASGLKEGGDNIKVTAGTYEVILDVSGNTYTLTKK